MVIWYISVAQHKGTVTHLSSLYGKVVWDNIEAIIDHRLIVSQILTQPMDVDVFWWDGILALSRVRQV